MHKERENCEWLSEAGLAVCLNGDWGRLGRFCGRGALRPMSPSAEFLKVSLACRRRLVREGNIGKPPVGYSYGLNSPLALKTVSFLMLNNS